MVLRSILAFFGRLCEFFWLHFLLIKHKKSMLFRENATALWWWSSRRWPGCRVHLFTLRTPIGFDDDIVTKLGEEGRWNTERKMVIRTKDKHYVFTKIDITGQGNWMHESARADVIFVAFWSSCSNVFVCAAKWGWVNSRSRSRLEVGLAVTATPNDEWFQSHTFCFFCSWVWLVSTNITWNGSFRGVGAREILKAFRKRTFFSLVCMNVPHHVDKKPLCSMSVLKSGWMSTLGNLPVFTAVIKLSAFADPFVKQSHKQFWVGMWARSWILPEQASFRNMEIMWIVSFCLS